MLSVDSLNEFDFPFWLIAFQGSPDKKQDNEYYLWIYCKVN